MENAFTAEELKIMQERPPERKVMVTQTKILELCLRVSWKIAVSFSGGKDSTVLLDIVARVWAANKEYHNNSPLVVLFANTSNEFVGMERFVKQYCEYIRNKYNIEIDLRVVHGKQTFYDVIKEKGYPVVSKKVARQVREIRGWIKENNLNWNEIVADLATTPSCANDLRAIGASNSITLYLTGMTAENKKFSKNWMLSKKWYPLVVAPFEVSEECCGILKKAPIKSIESELKLSPVIAEMADEGGNRRASYLKTGCNAFKGNKARSKPMGFWLEQDVLWYIYINKLPYFNVYGELKTTCDNRYCFSGEQRTGCKLCLFGIQFKREQGRIEHLNELEPQTVAFALRSVEQGGLGYKQVIDYLNKYCGCKISIKTPKRRSLF